MKSIIAAMMWGLLIVFLLAKPGVPPERDVLMQAASKLLSGYQITYIQADSVKIAICKLGSKTKYFVLSSDLHQIRGYNGVSVLGILFDHRSVVEQVWIVSSPDTRHYLNRIKQSGFLDQYRHYDGNHKLKSLTGATITSNAINTTVQEVVSSMKVIIPTIDESQSTIMTEKDQTP
jgi:hypothetical protein